MCVVGNDSAKVCNLRELGCDNKRDLGARAWWQLGKTPLKMTSYSGYLILEVLHKGEVKRTL